MDTETLSLGAGKQHTSATPLRFTQPSLQHGERGSGDGCAAFLAPLANYAYMSAVSENDVLAFEPGHLR